MRLVILLLLTLLHAQTGHGLYSPASSVIDLDSAAFNANVLKSKVPVLVEFYAPWCGHCQKLAPTYEKVAQSLKDIAKVVAVNADNEKNRELAQIYGVNGYPTIKLFKKGVPQDYNGPRDRSPMVEFVKQNLSSKVKRITSSNVDEFISKTEVPRALLFMPNDVISAFFKTLSVNLAGRMMFGQVSAKSNQEVFQKFSIENSGLLVFPAQSKDPIKFSKKLKKNRSQVQAFIHEHALPRDPSELKLPKLIDQSCLDSHCLEANAALCAIGISSSTSDFNKLEAVNEASEATDSSLCKFSWIEGQKHQNITSAFGIQFNDQMNLVFFSPRKSRFALYSGDFTKNGIIIFLGDIVKGKVTTLPVKFPPKIDDSTSKCRKQPATKSSSKSDYSRDEL